MYGTLVVAATPIGNAHDASDRLRQALTRATVIAAEDTRRLRRLADDLGVPLRGRVLSLFEGNEARRSEELLHTLESGHEVLLVSDAGTPAISDPGHRLVSAAAARGIRVTAVPGPSAVATAVAVSGLVSGPFCFEGFLPRKSGERRRRLAALAADPRPCVFFESPRRLAVTLGDLVEEWGDRPAVVCRELTKIHEEVVRGSLAELARWAEGDVLGEVTLVVAGAGEGRTPVEDLADQVAALVALGHSRRDAVAEVAERTGTPRRAVYQASLDRRPGAE
ncbi:MAG: 16S rRNA (cytidine(1402)-2'-O)-methyltransferase [Candidatus Nanopelagicales bacterium]